MDLGQPYFTVFYQEFAVEKIADFAKRNSTSSTIEDVARYYAS